MVKYVAMVKKKQGQTPVKCTFTATNIGAAINTMSQMMGVGSTAELYEFEVLEVLGTDSYKLAARKMPTKIKPHICASAIKSAPEKIPKVVYNETEYSAYEVRAA